MNGRSLKVVDITREQQEEVNLYQRWARSEERKILEEYAGQPIENVPEEFREKIARLRKFGLGKKEKTLYEQVIEFLETHNGKLMQGSFRENGKQLTVSELTQEQQEERNLYSRWKNSREREILAEYAGQPIENVPEEYREKIARLREFGLVRKEKTTYEEVIEFLEIHDGKLMRNSFSSGRKKIKSY